MPQSARIGDPISHSMALPGLIVGAVAGLAIGAAVVATGGAAAIAIAAGASAGIGLGGAIGEFAGGFASHTTGTIIGGSANTATNHRQAARATDQVVCSWHGQQTIAEGSGTVRINGLPAARCGDRITCGAVIASGSGNTSIGGPTQAVSSIKSEVPFIAEALVGGFGMIGGIGAVALAGAGLRGVMAARLGLGLCGSMFGSHVGSTIGGQIFGEGSFGQRQLTLLGGLVGGGLGGGLAGGRLDPINYRVTQEGIGANGGNVRVRYVGGKKVPTAMLRGQKYDLNGMESRPLDYTKRSPEEVSNYRRPFDSSVRKNWLKNTVEHHEGHLRNAGLDDDDLDRMRAGKAPRRYDVHHIEPLDDGGTNTDSNLILMRKETEHKLLTGYQNSMTRGMKPGDSQIIEWPYPQNDAVIWPLSDDLSATPSLGDD